MIEVDGSHREGGGAILRQSLAMSMYTGKDFEISSIRANRPEPGMKMQHLKALNTAQRLVNAEVEGNHQGSTKVVFKPESLTSQSIKVDVETAGSITLLMQTFLLPCVFSLQNFKFELLGGTDVKWSQPVDYFANVLLPHLKRFADFEFDVEKRGYYPKGDGKVKLRINGGGKPEVPIDLTEQGRLQQIKGVSHASQDLASREVADRQAKNAELLLSRLESPVNVRREYSNTSSTGSGITLWAIYGNEEGADMEEPVILGGDSLGEPSRKAEEVGEEAARSLRKEMESGAAADKYLADQLIPFMAVAGGSLKTSEITEHARSNIYVAEKFLDVDFEVEDKIISTR